MTKAGPPNSPDLMLLDAVVNVEFKKCWALRAPRTLCQGVRAANEIVKDLNKTDLCKKYVAHYDDLCREIIASGGEASHHMK